MSKDKSNLGVKFFVVVAAVVLGALLGGWVLAILWGWFIVPLFHLPALATGSAIGLIYTARFLSGYQPPRKSDGDVDVEKEIALTLVTPLFVLAFGWVLHLFVV